MQQPGFQGWAQITRTRHDLLWGKIGVDIAGIATKLEDRSPALRWHRTQYTNKIDAAEIVIKVSARSNTPSQIQGAQDFENFIYAVYHDLTRSTGENADRASKDQMVTYGCGIKGLRFAPNVLRDIFGKKKHPRNVEEVKAALSSAGFEGNPFALATPALETVAWTPDRRLFCEVGVAVVSDLKLAYPDDEGLQKWIASSTMREGQAEWQHEIKTHHLEDPDFIYDVFEEAGRDDKLLMEARPNLMGRPWYSLMPGHENSETVVAQRYAPLIGELYDLVAMANFSGTLIASGGLQTGRNTLQLVRDGNKGAADIWEYQRMPTETRPALHTFADDAVVEPPPGHHYEAMPVPPQDQLLAWHKLTLEQMDRWGFPTSLATDAPMRGEANSGAQAAYYMEAASDHLEPALRNVAKSWKELFLGMADVIHEVGLPVTIPVQMRAQGQPDTRDILTLKPEDVREYDIEVSFESIPASVKFALQEADLRLVEAGRMSEDTFFARHYQDPIAEREKIRAGRLREPIEQMALQDVMQIVAQAKGSILEQAAGEMGVPLPPAASPAGGPAPGETQRMERPAGAALPGVGAPDFVPEQTPPGQAAPPTAGTQAVGVAQ